MKTHQPHLGKEHFRQKECVCKGPEHMGINSTCLGNTQRIDSNWIPDPGIEPASPVSPALQADSFPAEPSGKTLELVKLLFNTPVSFVEGQSCPLPQP